MELRASSTAALASTGSTLMVLAGALAAAAAVEFFTLRVVLQSGPAMGDSPTWAILIGWFKVVGLAGLTAAVILSCAVLAATGLDLLRDARIWSNLLGAAVITAAGIIGLSILSTGPGLSLLMPAMVVSAIICLLLLLHSQSFPRRTRIVASVFALTGLAISLNFAAIALVGSGLRLPAGFTLLHLAELLLVAGGAAAILLADRPIARRAMVSGVIAGIALLAWQLAIPWLPSTIAIWNFGVTTFLPGPVYAIALGLFVVAVTQLMRTNRPLSIALVLIAFAGLKWDVAYFNLLGITGLLLLARSVTDAATRGAWFGQPVTP
jgi:hypothetical protein